MAQLCYSFTVLYVAILIKFNYSLIKLFAGNEKGVKPWINLQVSTDIDTETKYKLFDELDALIKLTALYVTKKVYDSNFQMDYVIIELLSD
jgi:hypothetical protein